MATPSITIYSRPDCHLCEEMQAVVAPLAAQVGATVEVVDIGSNPELEARFGMEIPVLFVDGRKVAKFRITGTDLRRHLRSLA
ncbi:MAG TPA: glutaredoxin family protein [Candidatus Acidoferrales bacterium]|nr:glutaredoxin family protein [Candidatus Acidoferrales bacterium]